MRNYHFCSILLNLCLSRVERTSFLCHKSISVDINRDFKESCSLLSFQEPPLIVALFCSITSFAQNHLESYLLCVRDVMHTSLEHCRPIHEHHKHYNLVGTIQPKQIGFPFLSDIFVCICTYVVSR